MTTYDKGNGEFLDVGGFLVEKDALNIVERIKTYDPDLDVMCLDPLKAEINDAPFVLVWKGPDGILKKVFEFYELNEQVLERIYNADQHRFDAFLKINAIEKMVAKRKEDRYKDENEENKAILEAAVRNHTSSFSFVNRKGDLVKVHENAPRTKNKAKKSFSKAGGRS